MNREEKFLNEITPIILKLDEDWFPPDQKTPDGQHYYACSWCDMGCGGHVSHDPDCYYERARMLVREWRKIEIDPKNRVNPLGPLSPEDTQHVFNFKKVQATLDVFLKPLLNRLVPFDYDPSNKGVVCTCSTFEESTMDKHSPNCVEQKIAKIVSDFFKPKED